MIKKKRSAIEASTLVLYILLVAVTLSLVGATVYYIKLGSQDIRKRACEWDIVKAALSKKLPDAANFLTLGNRQTSLTNCRRDKLGDLVIKYDDVVEKGLINQDKTSKIIADEMVECWKMVGEGKIDPFSNWKNMDTSYCMLCTTIKFDKKLGEYYLESLTNKEVYEKRKEKGVILSPIKWMTTHEYSKGQSYYEYIYHSEPKFTNKDLGDMDKQFLIEDTAILLKLYKFEDKNIWKTIVSWGPIIVGALLIALGATLSFTGLGAVIGVPLTTMGVKISIAGVAITAGVVLMVSGGVALAGVWIFDPVSVNPYSECQECNGIGSIKIIPPVFDLSTHVQIKYPKTEDRKEITENGPYCDIIVN
ncbi:MAG: hypothetical protein KKC75_06210 [Nanoarchaeota archaeon]|nr:hypothetical protein [Nanoarchaeota archaeon]MBU1004273.1 hypothetical protein [Nanoarchaeota archaeon]MBU1946150.1 hypothetical protein [Nanoarchaeota archaeon]